MSTKKKAATPKKNVAKKKAVKKKAAPKKKAAAKSSKGKKDIAKIKEREQEVEERRLEALEKSPTLPNKDVSHSWENVNLANVGGRPAMFDTPEKLWLCAKQYFEWCVANPLMKHEAVKSGDNCGTLVDIPTVRPFTIHGLCVFIGASPSWFRTKKAIVRKKIYEIENTHVMDEENRIGIEDKEYQEAVRFLAALSVIESVIYQQKYEYAAVNIFNSNFIARDLNLQDGTNHTHTLNGDTDSDTPPVTQIVVHDTKIELPEDEDDVN